MADNAMAAGVGLTCVVWQPWHEDVDEIVRCPSEAVHHGVLQWLQHDQQFESFAIQSLAAALPLPPTNASSWCNAQ